MLITPNPTVRFMSSERIYSFYVITRVFAVRNASVFKGPVCWVRRVFLQNVERF